MIPFQEEISPIRFQAGEWIFEVTGEKGRYEMITFPDGDLYQLTYPNGEQDHGKIDNLFRIKNKLRKYERGLIQWIYQAVHWYQDEQYRQKYKFERKEIKLEGRKYIFEFCPRNEEVSLVIPGIAAVITRSVASETFPEIYALEGGMFSQLLNNIVLEAYQKSGREILGETYQEKKLTTPILFHNPSEFIIDRNRYLISYDMDTDLLFIQSETRNIKTYLAALDVMLPEFQTLHNGELARQVFDFAAEVRANKNPLPTYADNK